VLGMTGPEYYEGMEEYFRHGGCKCVEVVTKVPVTLYLHETK
jgi:hypothetical protein